MALNKDTYIHSSKTFDSEIGPEIGQFQDICSELIQRKNKRLIVLIQDTRHIVKYIYIWDVIILN